MRKAISAAAIAGVVSVLMLGSVTATHWSDTYAVGGNPPCDDGFKYENPAGGDIVSGSLTVPGGSIDITVTNTSSGPTFSFVANGFLVEQVTVKGGNGAQLYFYVPPTDSDSGLHSPLNTRNGKWYGLSHLCFFGDEKKGGGDPGKGKD